MKKGTVLICDVCGKPAMGVASSLWGAISHAYCSECALAGRDVYDTVVGGCAFLSGKADLSAEAQESLVATLDYYGKSEEEFWKDVKGLEKDHEKEGDNN